MDLYSTVLAMTNETLVASFVAGDSYPDVWIRDLNTFITMASGANPQTDVRNALNGFFDRQNATSGEVPDGYRPNPNATSPYEPPPLQWPSCTGDTPDACKNNVETDQESSLVSATRQYVDYFDDIGFLTEHITQLELALDFLANYRTTDTYNNLIWGGTTFDWGDCQAEDEVQDCRILEPASHRAIDVYDNAMYALALQDLIYLESLLNRDSSIYQLLLDDLRSDVRKYLWNDDTQKFTNHLYLEEQAFDPSFDEDLVYYHGGTTIAMLAGFLTNDEVAASYQRMKDNVELAGGEVTVGLTMYPPYPSDLTTKMMGEYTYQNGGDWAWFGGRTVSALAKLKFCDEAREALQPMLERVVANNGFYEWWGKDNTPNGSSTFHGSAGVLGLAIQDVNDNC